MNAPSRMSRKMMTVRVANELSTSKNLALGEILGLVKGDGSISRTSLRFFNSEFFCARIYLKNLHKVFRLDRENFSYYLDLPEKSNMQKSISKWKKYLNIKKKINGKKVSKIKKKHGMIRIHRYDKQIIKILKERIKKIESGKEQNEDILVGFLRGFFAAEGCVIPGKVHKKVPNSVQFPQKWRKWPEIISKILKLLEIESRVVIKDRRIDYYCSNITGFKNFKRFYDLGLADLHPEKKRKIRIGLTSYKRKISRRGVTANKVLNIIANKPIDRHEIYRLTKMHTQHVNEILYSKKKSFLLKNEYLEKFTDEKNIKWRITDKGKTYLNNITKSE